jgi:hypothetical protein
MICTGQFFVSGNSARKCIIKNQNIENDEEFSQVVTIYCSKR